MSLSEAKELIARYLAGDTVSREELAKAREVLGRDIEYDEYMRDLLGMNVVIECEVAMESLAEFAGMSEEQRLAEMPGVLEHIKTCGKCSAALREITGVKSSPAAQPVAVFRIGFLKERVRLIEEAGKAVWRVLFEGPLPARFPTRADSAKGWESRELGVLSSQGLVGDFVVKVVSSRPERDSKVLVQVINPSAEEQIDVLAETLTEGIVRRATLDIGNGYTCEFSLPLRIEKFKIKLSGSGSRRGEFDVEFKECPDKGV